jgi:DNA-directed RNA polymerase subunit RPC12/RpoP
MEIFCQKCRKRVGQIADEKIPLGQRASVKCPQCGEKIILTRPSPAAAPGLMPGAADAAASSPPPPGSEIPGRAEGAGGSGAPLQATPDYDFSIGAILKEAWQKTHGVKGPLWGGILVVILAMLGLSTVLGLLAGQFGSTGSGAALAAALQITLTIAMYPFLAGIMMIGIRRSVDLPVNWKLAFGYFSYLLPIVISVFLTGILTSLGFMLLIIPGIYLSLAYLLTIPLIVDQGLGPWQAMEASRKAISKHWFKVFGLYFVMVLVYLVSMIPLGLGMIWTMPMLIMVGSILYREIFGVRESA